MKKKYHLVTSEEKERIKELYFTQKKSLNEIARILDRNSKTIWYWIRDKSKPRTWSESQILANKLGRGQGIKNYRKANGNWKGGKVISSYGYVQISLDRDDPFYCMMTHKGYIFEHRYIMAQHLGRPLTDYEIVHHLNGIRHDNRITNLVIVSHKNHPTHTLSKLMRKRIRELEAQLAQQKLNLF